MTAGYDLGSALSSFITMASVPSHLAGTRPEKGYQLWTADVVKAWLDQEQPGRFRVKVEQAGGGVFPVKMFNTSFWPDVSVETPDGERILAIEVKCLNRRDLPDLIAQALGQAVIYREEYPQSLVVFVLLEELQAPPSALIERVAAYNIAFAVVDSTGVARA